MAISASEKALSRVFTSDYRFVIPTFQRAYQWRREQMAQLVGDIIDACGSSTGPYFLGSLILVREDDSPVAGRRDAVAGRPQVCQVIDGQQRLVSLTILFAVLEYLEDDDQLTASLDGLVIEAGDKLRGIEPEPRLKLRDKDAVFFREYVQQGNLEMLFDLRESDCETQAQRNMLDNARYAFDELGRMSAEDRHRFATYLVNDVMLVIVETGDLSGAYRIFDVMNMRGVPLTASDVFKAKVVSSISPGARDAYARCWDDIMEPFGDDAGRIERFFADLHLILTGRPMCEQLLADFSADVLAPYFHRGDAIDFIDDVLRPYACAWRILDHPGESMFADDVKRLLTGLNDYPNDDWRPVAMWGIVHSVSNIDDPDAAAALAGDDPSARADRATSRKPDHAATERSAPAVPPMFHDVSRLTGMLAALDRVAGIDVLNGEGALKRRTRACGAIRDLRKGLSLQRIGGFVVSAEEQRTAMMHLRGELALSDDMKRLLLIRANEQRAGEGIVRPRSLNAVRLLPEQVGPKSTFADWPADLCDYWVDRIGNYALTQASGKSMANLDDFDERRDRILKSASSRRFPLTAQLSELSALTPEALQARQEETIKLIAAVWQIRYDEQALVTSPSTSMANQAAAAGGGHGSSHRARINSRRVTVAQAVSSGLLAVGETLAWERPRKHERWEITVTEDGLRLPDGSVVSSPTAAAKAVCPGASAKLDAWKRVSDGKSLADIWRLVRKYH
ncbi:GmrSD restriction endonuclease domain-containing protein [Bifidobacterium choloepi]|uniref:DUF262 domain-containing protein n=1 Tax=Bifidobacterium choloepi TaxID=2614131 RepID=A0A6I5N376_9BIFI|nr:DUF262 domain-containing protein [Bifidobacterium choloepi]NEG70109.1 DUF262 domain-containing protein [Bifidobacterium choloepi]